jgi:hypothetical protein
MESPMKRRMIVVVMSDDDVMRSDPYGRVRKKSYDAAATAAAISAATRSPEAATATTTRTSRSTRSAPSSAPRTETRMVASRVGTTPPAMRAGIEVVPLMIPFYGTGAGKGRGLTPS